MIFRGRRIHKQWCEYDEESVHYIKMQDRKDIIIRAGFNLRDVRHWEEYDNSDNYYKNNDPSTVIFFEGGFNMVILVKFDLFDRIMEDFDKKCSNILFN